MERVAILIVGILRSFSKHLWPFLKTLPENYDIYISIPKDDKDKFFNKTKSIEDIIKHDKIKAIYIDSDEPTINNSLSQREKNTIYQWYRLYKLFNTIPNIYKKFIRCRPDIKIECNKEEFISIVDSCNSSEIIIPIGYNIFDNSFITEENKNKYINDQFAIASYDLMKYYVNMYMNIEYVQPIISEVQLYKYLQDKTISRINLPYRLILSDCFSIAIAGDSGAGKSYISKLIESILPFDNSLLLETDRYHKWERGSTNYLTYTHLSPEANNLEKLAEDAYALSLGESIYTVDYDHSTGKFTKPEYIESSPFVVFCGLHTLYKETMRDICDLKIYIDTDPSLKFEWKLERDSKHRGATPEQILKTIERRKDDYETYIVPQKEHADIIITYMPKDHKDIKLIVSFKNELITIIGSKIVSYADSITQNEYWTYFTFSDPAINLTLPESLSHLQDSLKSGYDSIIQYIVLCLVWN